MRALLPFLKLYKRYFWQMLLGMILALLTLLASIFLLALSGWFLAATAFVGFAGLYTFNYMLPAAGVRGAAILRTAARYAERLVSHNTTFLILSFLRTMAFEKILPLTPGKLQNYQKADLLNRFIADIDNLDHFYLKLLSPFIISLFSILVIFFGLSPFNLTLATVITIVLLLTIFSAPLLFFQAGKTQGERLTTQKSQYREQTVNYLQGQAELAIFGAQNKFRTQLEQTEQQWIAHQKQQATLASFAQALILLIVGLLTLLVIWLAADGIPGHTPPFIALFIFVSLSCAELLAPIPNAFIYLGQVIASAKRITHLFEQKPDVLFPETGKSCSQEQAELAITGVSFNYPSHTQQVLSDISLTIPAGQHVALVGKTGCGKSTLLKLLTRAWDPKLGEITINSVNIQDMTEPQLRQMMAVVPQKIDILSASLKENLQIGDFSATDEELVTVLQQVGLEKLLETEDKLNLWLGEGGRPLSGGERRRLGIARAILHKAPLILMDEPTESLDMQTEQQIIALIKEVYQHKTILMITHRLVQHEMFDKVYLLENGQLSLQY
ncbi:heme ABC transporter ATP-binding protein/permease CydC [Zophobihabitans entericus]|uniref:Glutathione/L-cysteine transport system ATP-binding/permease protein CydC n=1 Tax=Zophobihabitans entericus TaxID=1635327 RepID=A0A6G9I9M7_9GAMM|nr:cysteine/glutathione ABC transporter ATP-binding protein/permease CydC [Zophobihabitans entericus]QIQ20935.1 cysteine/glutathione ABC transporter ATP-binding protein/permease CydC [Zophobihabitans entericus]